MATKTISLELNAYEKLRRARRDPRESFSSVVRRARWEDQPATGPRLLEDLRLLVQRRPEVLLPSGTLNAMARRRRTPRRASRWDR
jgi:hypothetical protein